ncbi:hypothetical protein B0H12DRAFT_1157481 [Mycena haematopus]|nr:hypothetical protein B0H12DRAFT_1157481 [Mycena haematopus]
MGAVYGLSVQVLVIRFLLHLHTGLRTLPSPSRLRSSLRGDPARWETRSQREVVQCSLALQVIYRLEEDSGRTRRG